MLSNIRKKDLMRQGYRIIGNHSAIKPCLWCKKSIRGEDVCYKKTFYGINSWRCIQSSVSVDMCNQECVWCWRDVNESNPVESFDEPKDILDGFIFEQRKALEGFYGYDKVDKKRLDEAQNPKHVALSLTGETCMYLKLPEMVEEIRKRGMTSFIVSNGTIPGMVRRVSKVKPTQFYITLPAPNKEVYFKVCKPSSENLWENINESLNLLSEFDRGTIRLTLVKGVNMLNAEEYADLIKDKGFKFVEVKVGMPVGYARYRMSYSQMPLHKEIRDFSEKIAKQAKLKMIDEKPNSRVVLLMREDSDDRIMEF